MDTQAIATDPVTVTPPEYSDKRFNAIDADYFKDVNDQMLKTRIGNHYFRTNHQITFIGLARALRVLQYFNSVDGNMEFSREEILKRLTGKLYFDGCNWWSNSIHSYSTPVKDALTDEVKMKRAEVMVGQMFSEIK